MGVCVCGRGVRCKDIYLYGFAAGLCGRYMPCDDINLCREPYNQNHIK